MIQITEHRELGGCRGYDSVEERDADILALRAEGYDHFVTYRDTQAEVALSYGKCFPPMATAEIYRSWYPKPGNRGYDLLC
jgi:hypothetical protein